ncbi:metallophosphoesterase [Rhizobium sp. Rhizsp82]|uniref:metallophosphoesterase n=1 Tax=Rhizobium sp. Rhizsp82 TaxID=3243057 RepID=UPI0039B5D337
MRFTIAIGDIHGMWRIAKGLLADLTARYPENDSRFIFLGDLVDRGGANARAITDLCEFFKARPESVLILGNHDEYLLKCLQGTLTYVELKQWISNGGYDTLASYGYHGEYDLKGMQRDINRAVPDHKPFLERAVSMFHTERHCFVHAGVDPGQPLNQQDDRSLRWIRERFLDYPGPFEKVIVHGHSITKSGWPEVHPHRVAIDTGSYRTGRISAAVFDNDVLADFVCAEQVASQVVCRYFDAAMVEIAPMDNTERPTIESLSTSAG